MERATLISLALVAVLLFAGSIASFVMANWWWAFCQLGMMFVALYAVSAQMAEIKEEEEW